MLTEITLNPCHHDGGKSVDLPIGKRLAGGNAVPSSYARAATGGSRMLSDENRVASIRRLLAVLGWVRVSNACAQKFGRMGRYDTQSFTFRIGTVLGAQGELRTKLRMGELAQHGDGIIPVILVVTVNSMHTVHSTTTCTFPSRLSST